MYINATIPLLHFNNMNTMALMEHRSEPTFNDRTSLILSIRQLCYVTSDILFIYIAEGGALMSRFYEFALSKYETKG